MASGKLSNISNEIFSSRAERIGALVILGAIAGCGILALFGVEFSSIGFLAGSGSLVGWAIAYSATRPRRWRRPVALILIVGWVTWWLVGLVTVFLFPTVSSWIDPAYNLSASPLAMFLYGVQISMLMIAAFRLINHGAWREL